MFHGETELKQEDAVKILKLAQQKELPENLDSNSELDLNCVKDLVDYGFLQAIDISSKSGVGFMEPRITLAGVEYLETHSKQAKWYHSFPNRIAVLSLFVAIIGLWFGLK